MYFIFSNFCKIFPKPDTLSSVSGFPASSAAAFPVPEAASCASDFSVSSAAVFSVLEALSSAEIFRSVPTVSGGAVLEPAPLGDAFVFFPSGAGGA